MLFAIDYLYEDSAEVVQFIEKLPLTFEENRKSIVEMRRNYFSSNRMC